MGIGFVLLFWGVIGLAVAIVGAFFARRIAATLIRPCKDNSAECARRRAIRLATILPIACLLWAAAIFLFQGFVNTAFLHRDIGLGDSFYCPLPNGYSIFMIGVSDRGTVYNPKTQLLTDSISDRRGAISGVRKLQVAGSVLLGGFDSNYAEHFWQHNRRLDQYFLLDTRTGFRTDFLTEGALREAASVRGIDLRLEPIFSVYRKYRVTGFDIFAVCLLWLPPIIAFLFLIRSIARLRRAQGFPGPTGHEAARA